MAPLHLRGRGLHGDRRAAQQTYSLGPDDVDHAIEVQETAVNSAGDSAPVASGPTAAITAEPPSASGSPVMSGTDQVGRMLSEGHGTWSNAPTGYTYQWLRCDSGSWLRYHGRDLADIHPDQRRPRAVAPSDRNRSQRRRRGRSGHLPATGVVGEPGAAVPTNTAPPQITGTLPQQGQLLTLTNGSWDRRTHLVQRPVAALRWQRERLRRHSRRRRQPVHAWPRRTSGTPSRCPRPPYGAGGVGGPVQSQPTAVVPAAPVRADAGDAVAGTTSGPVTLDGSASTPANLITQYSWRFGDGSTGTGETVQHQYAHTGTFTATVTVSTGAAPTPPPPR